LRAFALRNFLEEWVGSDESADRSITLPASERESSSKLPPPT
jgi:hypothetical protein